jgi:hypothetical protein
LVGEPNVNARQPSAPADDAKNSYFTAKPVVPGSRDRAAKRIADRDCADLTHPEQPRFNRFSSHRRHSGGLNQIHKLAR